MVLFWEPPIVLNGVFCFVLFCDSFYCFLTAVPGPVEELSVLNRTVGSVTITWREPNATNGIVSYRIFYKVKDEQNRLDFTFYNLTSETKVTVVELREHTEYEFVVQPFTRSGGNGSSSTIQVKTLFGGAGGGPLNLKVEGVSSTALNVSWDHPENSSFLQDYTVVLNESVNVTVDRNKSFVLAGNLSIFTRYTVLVCANYPEGKRMCTNSSALTWEGGMNVYL